MESHYAADPEAQEILIGSLRTQIQDLFAQVTQLNTKLVDSYDRVSDLEDDLHLKSGQLRSTSLKISQLELERTQHLAALNTGLLVEKHHVTTELNRLMEKATEEAAQRGQAESARAAIEKDLDDLSATLFNQANTMVAEARFARHLSERKAEDAEMALKGAEEAVGVMQQTLQALQSEKEEAERKAAEVQALMGKGKWKEQSPAPSISIRLLGSHLAYQEFLLFIAHLRYLHANAANAPPMSNLLTLPFLTRLSTEDSEPTVRLDLAPSLNWLSRRSVLAAIHNGQLSIEPISSTTLLSESSHLSNAGISLSNNSHNDNIPCALCGVPIFSQSSSSAIAHSYSGSGSGSSWSTNLFRKPGNTSVNINSSSSTPPLPPRSISRTNSNSNSSGPISTQSQTTRIHHPTQIYIFRISLPSSALPSIPLLKSPTPSSIQSSPGIGSGTISPNNGTGTGTSNGHSTFTPLSISHSNSQSNTTIYPLCTSGWCLSRLRSTCSLWAFVRSGIIEKVWEEEIQQLTSSSVTSIPTSTTTTTATAINNSTSAPISTSTSTTSPTRVDGSSVISSTTMTSTSNGVIGGGGGNDKPPIPPRRRGLWGLASAIGEKAASWSENKKSLSGTGTPGGSVDLGKETKDNLKEQIDEKDKEIEKEKEKSLPLPPPPLPPRTRSPRIPVPNVQEEEEPKPKPKPETGTEAADAESTISPPSTPATVPPAVISSGPPPPIPRRNEGRTRTPGPPSPSPPSPSLTPTPSQVPAQAPVQTSVSASQPIQTLPLTPTRISTSPSSQAPPIPPRAIKRLSVRDNIGIGMSGGRPGTPLSVPLPESRPSTPSNTISNSNKNTNPNPNGSGPPSRTNSPAPLGVTGTPPPVPRRAAARNLKRLSGSTVPAPIPGPGLVEASVTAGGGNGEVGSRTSSPAPAPAPLPAPLPAPVSVSTTKVNTNVENENVLKSVEEKEKEDEDEDEDEGNDVVNSENLKDNGKEDENKDKEYVGNKSKEVGVEVAEVIKKENEPITSGTEMETNVKVEKETEDVELMEKKEKGMEGENLNIKQEISSENEKEKEQKEKEKEKTEEVMISLNDEDLPPPRNRVSNSHSNSNSISKEDEKEKDKGKKESKPEPEPESKSDKEKEKEMIIGDNTWEERTWKELTKLREDMFWARIGVLRT